MQPDPHHYVPSLHLPDRHLHSTIRRTIVISLSSLPSPSSLTLAPHHTSIAHATLLILHESITDNFILLLRLPLPHRQPPLSWTSLPPMPQDHSLRISTVAPPVSTSLHHDASIAMILCSILPAASTNSSTRQPLHVLTSLQARDLVIETWRRLNDGPRVSTYRLSPSI